MRFWRVGGGWSIERWGMAAGLLLAGLGSAIIWAASEPRPDPGAIFLLTIVAIVAASIGRRAGGVVTIVFALLAASRVAANGGFAELLGAENSATVVGRWLQALGLVTALASGVRALTRKYPRSKAPALREGSPIGRGRRAVRIAQVTGMLVLAAVGAELLSAYDDSTGRPAALLFALVFFGMLYGAPALVLREVARRRGWAWPSILLLAFALGVLQPGVIDQSLFSEDYRGIENWEASVRATWIAPLGFSAANAFNFVVGHVIFSFCAAIALAEAWRPSAARRPWLGAGGTLVAALAYLGAAAIVMSDVESTDGSLAQVAGALAIAAIFIVTAVLVGERRRGSLELVATPAAGRNLTESAHSRRAPCGNLTGPAGARRAPSLKTTTMGAVVWALLSTPFSEGSIALVIAAVFIVSGALLLRRLAARDGWDVQHIAAVALGFLLCRGLLAFTYYPLVGEVEAFPKFAHNVVMLGLVCVAGAFALRSQSVE